MLYRDCRLVQTSMTFSDRELRPTRAVSAVNELLVKPSKLHDTLLSPMEFTYFITANLILTDQSGGFVDISVSLILTT